MKSSCGKYLAEEVAYLLEESCCPSPLVYWVVRLSGGAGEFAVGFVGIHVLEEVAGEFAFGFI